MCRYKKVYSSRNDNTVLGTEFYIMEYVKQRIFSDSSLPSIEERRDAYRDILRVVTNSYSIDYNNVDFSNSTNQSSSSSGVPLPKVLTTKVVRQLLDAALPVRIVHRCYTVI